jgi:hypothetical protein
MTMYVYTYPYHSLPHTYATPMSIRYLYYVSMCLCYTIIVLVPMYAIVCMYVVYASGIRYVMVLRIQSNSVEYVCSAVYEYT